MKRFHLLQVRSRQAFSLLELLVSMTILSALTALLILALSQTQETWARTKERIGQFREARISFETVEKRLSAATVNAYWGYDDPEHPEEYRRQSALHFVAGPAIKLFSSKLPVSGHATFFQAPFGFGGSDAGTLGGGRAFDGIEKGVNTWGYFVEFGPDNDAARPMRPEFLDYSLAARQPRFRFRLMEYRVPTEKMSLFEQNSKGIPILDEASERTDLYQWFSDSDRRTTNSNPIAENILFFGIRPRVPGMTPHETAIAPNYFFDSRRFQWSSSSSLLARQTRHQIPPVVDLFLVALEEPSFARYLEREGIEAASALAAYVNERFNNSKQLEQDLLEVEEYLIELGIQNRVFQTSIAIRTGKWQSES